MKRNSYNDSTIVEKTLITEKYTGMIESSLSEAGINLGTRQNQK